MEMYQNVGKNNSFETNKTKKPQKNLIICLKHRQSNKTTILCRHPNTGKELSTNKQICYNQQVTFQTRTLLRSKFMCVTYWSVPWIRQSVAGLSSRRPGFDPSIVHMTIIVEVVGHLYLTTSWFPTVTFHQRSIFVHWHYISLANDIIIK